MRKEIVTICAILSLTSCQQSRSLPPVYSYGVNQGVGSLGAHVIQKNDTLWKISQKYNLDLRAIIETNKISPPYHLVAGSRINLPAPQTYTVRAKDSIYTISRLFSTTQTEIASLNRLKAPYKLAQGQTLRIPQNYEVYAKNDVQQDAPSVVMQSASSPVPQRVEVETLPPTMSTSSAEPPQPVAPTEVVTASSTSPSTATTPQKTTKSESLPARTGKFLKPVNGKVISSFGNKADGQHNDGINIQAMKGDPVRAAENGMVVYVGNEIEGYGNLILLRHEDQYVTAYAHLAKSLVKKGDVIRRGQAIGTVGQTGLVDKPQLHFEIRKGKKAINPEGLI